MHTSSTPLILLATLAVSIAVFPPPIITTFLPISVILLSLYSLKNCMAFIKLQPSRSIFSWISAPVAIIIFSYPSSISSLILLILVFNLTSIPRLKIKSISFSIQSTDILNSGIIFLTTPPSLFSFSNIVTFFPFLARKYAADSPAGPPPITAIFPAC